MPVMYVCGACNFPLSVFVKVGQNSYGVPTPDEVIAQYGGICLKCGFPLRRPGLNDVVIKVDGKREFVRRIFEIQKESTTGTRFLNRYLEQLDLDPRIIEEIKREVLGSTLVGEPELEALGGAEEEASLEESSS